MDKLEAEYEERCGIYEHDAGLTKEWAEEKALSELTDVQRLKLKMTLIKQNKINEEGL